MGFGRTDIDPAVLALLLPEYRRNNIRRGLVRFGTVGGSKTRITGHVGGEWRELCVGGRVVLVCQLIAQTRLGQ